VVALILIAGLVLAFTSRRSVDSGIARSDVLTSISALRKRFARIDRNMRNWRLQHTVPVQFGRLRRDLASYEYLTEESRNVDWVDIRKSIKSIRYELDTLGLDTEGRRAKKDREVDQFMAIVGGESQW
jgi:hypothetical protein